MLLKLIRKLPESGDKEMLANAFRHSVLGHMHLWKILFETTSEISQ